MKNIYVVLNDIKKIAVNELEDTNLTFLPLDRFLPNKNPIFK
jgi:hypothetical protein